MFEGFNAWAFEENFHDRQKAEIERYEAIRKAYQSFVQQISIERGVMTRETKVYILPGSEFSPKDLFIYCAKGDTCFGGSVESGVGEGNYTITMYTD